MGIIYDGISIGLDRETNATWRAYAFYKETEGNIHSCRAGTPQQAVSLLFKELENGSGVYDNVEPCCFETFSNKRNTNQELYRATDICGSPSCVNIRNDGDFPTIEAKELHFCTQHLPDAILQLKTLNSSWEIPKYVERML